MAWDSSKRILKDHLFQIQSMVNSTRDALIEIDTKLTNA